MEPASDINLDDIFAAVHLEPVHGSNGVAYNAYADEPPKHSRSNTKSSTHVSSVHYNQHVPPEPNEPATPQPSSIVSATFISEHTIPPEPKSRATTASSASTIKPANHAELYHDHRHESVGGADLLDSVFSAVNIGHVEYSGSEASHHSAIKHIDDVLGEYTDAHDALSEHSHHSHHSHHSRRSHAPSQRSAYSAANHVANVMVADSFNALDLNGHSHYNGGPSVPEPDYETENYDHFGSDAHLPYSHAPREPQRRMTMDSQASLAETRYGGYDVHDDEGYPTHEEINLHHNEVAYQRPKQKAFKSGPALVADAPIHTGQTIKLAQLNREVADAHHRQALLSVQVDRERAEVERLRQQQLAKEAAVRAVGRGAAPVSSTGRSSSTSYANSAVSAHSKPSAPVSAVSRTSSRTSSYVPAAPVSGAHVSASHHPHSLDSIYDEEPTAVSEIAQRQIDAGTVVGHVGKFALVVPKMEAVEGFSSNKNVHKIVVGGHQRPTEEDKTVLLFGPIGSGKTSAIASMLNYLYDVKKENTFRFVLDGTEPPKSTGLTAYVINNSIFPYSITVVDTPGVPDQKGNRTVSTLIKTWFDQELVDAGAFRLDAISIVLRHDENQLGWPFIYELAAVKRMFGDDLKTNVLPIITNSEVLPQPHAIKSLAHANISFVEYYKVNNLGFQPVAKGISKLQHNLFFTHGISSLEHFFRDLQELIHPLLAILRSSQAHEVLKSHGIDIQSIY